MITTYVPSLLTYTWSISLTFCFGQLFHKDTRMHAIAHCHRANDIMELDLYPEALQAGLLEPSIVLAVLLLFPKAFGEPTEGEQAFIEGFAQGIGA